MEQKRVWERIIEEKVHGAFVNPYQDYESEARLKEVMNQAITSISSLKTTQDEDKCYLGTPNCIVDTEEGIAKVKKEVSIPKTSSSLEQVMEEVIPYFNGMYNLAHPKTMFNVVPAAGIPSMMGSFLGAMFNPNLVEQDYAGNIAALEIEVAAMISKLVGYDEQKSIGHFTFGGTGAYLFGTKLGLTKVLGKETRFTGIREDAQLLVSEVGHFAAINCSDWTGLGSNQIRPIHLNRDNSMDLNHLEETMEACYKEGKTVAVIVATIGTTDAFGVDDIQGISEVVDRFVERHKDVKRPFIYADAVIGWAWSMFRGYDFETNELELSDDAKKAIQEVYNKVQHLHVADAIGIDFHKTGFSCYNSTLVLVKDAKDLDLLARKGHDMAYLYQFSAYTPGKYTLECSRGGNYPLTAWCNLKYFGLDGYRAILAEHVEAEIALRKLFKETEGIVCLNEEDHGFVTLFRVYPSSLKEKYGKDYARMQYEHELCDEAYSEDLARFNQFQLDVASELRRLTFEENGPALSYTSDFRVSDYGQPIASLKAYPMTPFRNDHIEDLQRDVVAFVEKAMRAVEQ